MHEGGCNLKPKPKPCNRLYKPVCGNDNVTYSNKCLARNAGIKEFKMGPCLKKCKCPVFIRY